MTTILVQLLFWFMVFTFFNNRLSFSCELLITPKQNIAQIFVGCFQKLFHEVQAVPHIQ